MYSNTFNNVIFIIKISYYSITLGNFFKSDPGPRPSRGDIESYYGSLLLFIQTAANIKKIQNIKYTISK